MPRPRAKKLGSLFRFFVQYPKPSTTTASNNLNHYSTTSAAIFRRFLRPSRKTNNEVSISELSHKLHQRPSSSPTPDDSRKPIASEISSILSAGSVWEFKDDSSESKEADVDINIENDSDELLLPNLFNNSMPLRRKELSRERKTKWVFKNTQTTRFDKLVSMCLTNLGSGSIFQVLVKLGRETGLKEFNAFIKGCIETARSSKVEKVKMEQVLEIYRLFELMKERGFPIDEESFGPFLLYLIEMQLTDQFFLFLEIIKDEDPGLHPRLGYYEMLLWIEMNNEEKIQEFCNQIVVEESSMRSLLHENYLLALCERDRGKELPQLLEIIDITKVSSLDNVAIIFRSLGRLSLQHFAELFIQLLKDFDHDAQSISDLIYNYATSIKNLVEEDVIKKCRELHGKLDVELLPESYEKLISLCCDSLKVHLALDIVDEMSEAGVRLSTETLNNICRACEDAAEFILVRRIHSILHEHNLKANSETFRIIISLNVRMKDFDNAYAMLKDLQRFNVMPSASMYNAIIAGFYREKNMNGVRRVLQEMKDADVKPDSHTFSCLISNCTTDEEIAKYFEELRCSGVQVTKNIFMALINAYAVCGEFEKAKLVVLDKEVPEKNKTEIKSVLVSTLASHGKIADALNLYMEMKQSGCCLEPKAILSLIEHQQSEGELPMLLQLLEQVNDAFYWVNGCCRVILYCIRNKDLKSAVDLLEKLAGHFQDDELAREVIFDEVFSQIADMEPPDLCVGIGLLQAVKKDLNLYPSRKCLDFLLSACVSAKDLQKSQLVWKEYQIAGLPYNILSYLRMYQAYLCTGNFRAASRFLGKIPKDDPHVRYVIHACGVTYGTPKNKKKKKKA